MTPESDPSRPGVVATDGIDPEYKGGGAPKDINPETGQHKSYWTLSEEERGKGFVRPLQFSYKHVGDSGCGGITTVSRPIAETFARDPSFYGSTFCTGCKDHFPVGENGEFVWIYVEGTGKVGT